MRTVETGKNIKEGITINRREFLKMMGFALPGLWRSSDQIPPIGERGTEEEKKLPPNVVIVETPENRFRIIYGQHFWPLKPESLGGPNYPDCLFLEGITPDPLTVEDAESLARLAEKNNQYKEIVQVAKEKKVPICFGDLVVAEAIILSPVVIRSYEAGLGIILWWSSLTSLARSNFGLNRKMTRREFLWYAGKWSQLLLASYFSTHILPSLSFVPDIIDSLMGGDGININSTLGKISRFSTEVNEKIHPETEAIVLTLRNHVIAQKATTIAKYYRQKKPDGQKPEIAIAVGGGHIGIEQALQKNEEERIALIDKILRLPGLETTRRHIADIAEAVFTDKWKIRVFKDPLLATLENR